MPTKIAWTDETLNPFVGCEKIRAGCLNCYAERQACRNPKNVKSIKNGKWTGELDFYPERILKPLHWKRPRRIFWCSMSDPFHENVKQQWLDYLYAIILLTPLHTHILLTKRPNQMAKYWEEKPLPRILKLAKTLPHHPVYPAGSTSNTFKKNLWQGISCSTQKDVDEMWPILASIPAAVRFISLEPLLEAVYIPDDADWVIVGCERLAGNKAGRGCEYEIDWLRALFHIMNQCAEKQIKVLFIKQIPINGKVSENPNEWPEWARVREYPTVKE